MEKSATLNLRVNPDVKKNVESILASLGLTVTAAVDIYFRQIVLTGGIPFKIQLPDAPSNINADRMTREELRSKLENAYKQVEEGDVQIAAEAFAEFKRKRQQ